MILFIIIYLWIFIYHYLSIVIYWFPLTQHPTLSLSLLSSFNVIHPTVEVLAYVFKLKIKLKTFCFHWHAIQLSLSLLSSLHSTVDELAGVCLFVCKQTSVCLFAYIPKCAYHCLMYPAAIHIFVSVAWLMVCCRYDSPLPRPPQHCCPSGCCGGGTFLPLATKKPNQPLASAISGKSQTTVIRARWDWWKWPKITKTFQDSCIPM